MKKTIIILVVVVAAAVGIFELTKSDKKSTDASSTQTSTSSGDLSSASKALGVNSLLSDGKARTCTVTYAVSGVSGTATIYTDGSKLLRYDISSSESDSAQISAIYKDSKIYSWSKFGDTSYGAVTNVSGKDLSDAVSSLGSGSAALGSDSKLDCNDWHVDASKFVVPSDVTFTSITTPTT